MEIRCVLSERNAAVKKLEELTGERAVYTGPPYFNYTIGDFTVTRDSVISVDRWSADSKVTLRQLAESMVIPMAGEFYPQIDTLTASVPVIYKNEHDVHAIINLLYMLHARGTILRHLFGNNSFRVLKKLVQGIHDHRPCCASELMDLIYKNGGTHSIRGVLFTETKIILKGFQNQPVRENPWTYILAERISETCIRRSSVHAFPKKTSGIPALVYWLDSIGMTEKIYPEERKILIEMYRRCQ